LLAEELLLPEKVTVTVLQALAESVGDCCAVQLPDALPEREGEP
jgi:hypothetical protein